MAFKVKKDKKKVIIRGNKCIEQLHYEKLKYFKDLSDNLPQKKKELASIIKKNPRDCRVKDLEKHIKNVESGAIEIDYHLSVSKTLSDYISLCETSIAPVINVENMSHMKSDEKTRLSMQYYNICDLTYIEEAHVISKRSYSLRYCDICDVELLLSSEKVHTCTSCGKMFDKVCDGVSYNETQTMNIVYPFVYKRINYFKDWLAQIQASENVDIEESLIDTIKVELHKRNITDSSKLNRSKLKTILKEIDRPRYYEHIPLIICKLCGTKPLKIPVEIEERLIEMFKQIQIPYEELKGDRKNFFSYPYVLYKLCEILNLHDYLHHFQLLKNREKLRNQDRLWRDIVDNIRSSGDKSWVYTPTC